MARHANPELRTASRPLVVMLLLLIGWHAAAADPFTFNRHLPPAAPNGHYATSLATFGSLFLMGDSGRPVAGHFNAGAVDVINPITGAVVRTLVNPSPIDFGGFGIAVVAVGPHIAVGAPFNAAGGGAYLFDGATGALLKSFPKPFGGGFGATLAASGMELFVGSHNAGAWRFDADPGSPTFGALLQTYPNPEPSDTQYASTAIAVSGGTVFVGARYGQPYPGGTRAGAVYRFDVASGTLLGTILNPVPTDTAGFGQSIAVTATSVVVGAPFT